MTVTNFRSLKADVVNRNILSTDFFAEEATYSPTVGTPRSVTVKISAVVAADLEDTGDEEFEELIRVKVERSASGIDNPQLGDLLTRSVTVDNDRRPFTFRGNVPERSASGSHWVLMFGRNRHTGRAPRG